MIDVGAQQFFACDECPIICQLDRRLAIADGDPKSVDFQFDHCGCDKVEDEFFQCGYCEDAWVDTQKQPKKGQRKTGRSYRRRMRRKHLKNHIAKHGHTRCFGAPYPNYGYVDGEYVMIGSYLVRQKDSNAKVFYKRVSNRKVRHSKEIPQKGNGYRKLFDYWWTLY